MWEVVVVIFIVGLALYFMGRSTVRSLRSREKDGCGGCAGCGGADMCKDAGEEDR